MGQGASGLPGAPGGPPGGPGGDKKDDKKKKKFEPRPPMRTGKKKRKKGPSAAVRTPQGGRGVDVKDRVDSLDRFKEKHSLHESCIIPGILLQQIHTAAAAAVHPKALPV